MNLASTSEAEVEELTKELFSEAKRVLEEEPVLQNLLNFTVLAKGCDGSSGSLVDALAHTVCYRLLLKSPQMSGSTGPPVFCPHALHGILLEAFKSEVKEYGHTMMDSVIEDIRAVIRRDPAMDTALQVVLFSKGFCALVCHRTAFRLIEAGKEYTAYFLQSQCSAVFGVDIHPRSVIGQGVMLDHATGLVIGETAVVGDGCTILHGVTLGGTGKDHGDRHPKVGDSVLIGAGTSILGNIRVGDNCKIGAGSVVLREIPAFSTAVGAPAKIVGRVGPNERPGSDVDETLEHAQSLNKGMGGSVASSTTDETSSLSSMGETPDPVCPWRDVFRLGNDAPSGTITLCQLKDRLMPLGCTMAQIGSSYFALDTNMVGYIQSDLFVKRAKPVLQEGTDLNETTIDSVVEKVRNAMQDDNMRS